MKTISAVFALLAIAAVDARAQVCSSVPVELAPGFAQPGDLAGFDVAASGAFAFVGLPSNVGSEVGMVFAFRRVDGVWTFDENFSPSDARPGSAFGFSLACDGVRLVVGAPFDGPTLQGSVYVYERIGSIWTEIEKLSGQGSDFGFGRDVAIDGDTIVASGFSSGDEKVWVFRQVGGVTIEEANLSFAGGDFGASVDVEGGRVAVGAPAEGGGAGSGSVYVFERDGGWVATRIDAPIPQTDGEFGTSVALSGDRLLAGAPLVDTVHVDAGTAHLFRLESGSWIEEHTFEAIDPRPIESGDVGDRFGEGVAMEGDTILVGAPGHDTKATDSGAVFAFTRNDGDWILQQKFAQPVAGFGGFDQDFGHAVAIAGPDGIAGAPALATTSPRGSAWALPCLALNARFTGVPGGPGSGFGWSVAAFQERVVVGMPHLSSEFEDNLGSASVWVPRGSAWVQEAELVPDVVEEFANHGFDVAISGDTAVASAPGARFLGVRKGAVRVYVRSGSTWTVQQKIENPGTTVGDSYGDSIDLDGDTLVVGAGGSDPMGAESGSAYVYVRSGTVWSLQQTLVPDVVDPKGFFGFAVAVEGDTIVVGAPHPDSGNPGIGVVYVFTRSGGVWTPEAKFTDSPAALRDEFGTAVALSGDRLVVGSEADTGAGSASVYVRSGGIWTREVRLLQTDRQDFDNFGSSVSLEGDLLAVGARQDFPEPKLGSGTVTLFHRRGGVWSERQVLFATDGFPAETFGSSVAIAGGGSDVLAVGDSTKVVNFGSEGAAYAIRLDVLPPVLDCADLLVRETSPGGGADVDFTVTATDDVDRAPAIVCDVESGHFPSGDTLVECRATDDMLRESICTFTVHVVPDHVFFRRGNVNKAAGPIADVLFVNDSVGDPVERKILLTPSDPLVMRVEPPPFLSRLSPRVAMYLWTRAPSASTVRTLPMGIGTTCLPTPLNPGGTQPKFIANSIGFTGQLGVENWPGPPTSPAPTTLLSLGAVGREITLFAQGLILDAGSVHGTVAVTNGVLIVVSD